MRSEGIVLGAAALAGSVDGIDEPWWLVPLLLFVPDAFIVGYARSSRVWAWLYNLGHSTPAPALLGLVATLAGRPLWQGVALVWLAHIGMDRALGYGLKCETDAPGGASATEDPVLRTTTAPSTPARLR